MISFFKTVLSSSYFYFLIAFLVLIFAATRKNNNYFDVRSIVRNHIKIFDKTKFQYFVFYGIPLFLAVGTLINRVADSEVLGNINIVLSIFMSMLFAVLSIVGNYDKSSNNADYNLLLEETCTAILFETVLCIFALIISFSLLLTNECNAFVIVLTSVILYYLVYVIILQIFIIIKRLSVLLQKKK